ncbi:hypothetical protein CPB97_011025 [Podila verticillata]|nr:hypothetical protein CPB97_011025 [Podila verticillata]
MRYIPFTTLQEHGHHIRYLRLADSWPPDEEPPSDTVDLIRFCPNLSNFQLRVWRHRKSSSRALSKAGERQIQELDIIPIVWKPWTFNSASERKITLRTFAGFSHTVSTSGS